MENQIGKFTFSVEPFSEDFTGRLSWGYIGNHLLRCASLHAGMHGFGYDDVVRNRQAWVLSRLVVDIEEMPRTGEVYQIETWVSKVYRQFTDRLFAITSPEGRIYGHAHSVWALIDMDSRMPVDFSTLPDGGFSKAMSEREVPIKGAGRVKVKAEAPTHTLTAYYNDLDINGHVNSVRYIEMMLDLFSQEIYEEGKVAKRVEMSYCAESRCGNELQFFVTPVDSSCRHVEIRKANGEVVAKAALYLSE